MTLSFLPKQTGIFLLHWQ